MERGFIIEKRLANSFDNKKYEELDSYHKYLIDGWFREIDKNEIIYSNICERHSKPDIYVKIGNKIKYISIKSGEANSVHFEPIRSFILFLRELGISEKTQKLILLYHYGDGTLDGTGKTRFEYEKVQYFLKDDLRLANKELNNKEIIKKCLDRFIFSGVFNPNLKVDYLYIGDVNFGVYASKEDIKRFILNKDYDHLRCLHIGPLTLQPYLRDINKKSKHPEKRNIIQVKWHYMLTDLLLVNEQKNK